MKIIFGRIYIVLRKKISIYFFCKRLLIHVVYIIKKIFEKIYFKCLKIAIKDGRSNPFARSNLFAPTVAYFLELSTLQSFLTYLPLKKRGANRPPPQVRELRASPCPFSSLFMLMSREDKGGPIQLLFPITKPHYWLERGSRSRKKGKQD